LLFAFHLILFVFIKCFEMCITFIVFDDLVFSWRNSTWWRKCGRIYYRWWNRASIVKMILMYSLKPIWHVMLISLWIQRVNSDNSVLKLLTERHRFLFSRSAYRSATLSITRCFNPEFSSWIWSFRKCSCMFIFGLAVDDIFLFGVNNCWLSIIWIV